MYGATYSTTHIYLFYSMVNQICFNTENFVMFVIIGFLVMGHALYQTYQNSLRESMAVGDKLREYQKMSFLRIETQKILHH